MPSRHVWGQHCLLQEHATGAHSRASDSNPYFHMHAKCGISSSLTTFFVTNYDTEWVVSSGKNSSCKTNPCWLYVTVLTILQAILCAVLLTCVGQFVQTPTTHCTWPEDRGLSRSPSPLGTFACKNVEIFYCTAMFRLLVSRHTDDSLKFCCSG